MRNSAYFILISAALHVLLWALAGFSTDALFLLVPAAIYVLLAFALMGDFWGSRWISFIAMLVGSAAALGSFVASPLEPYWMFALIFVADMAAAIFLFGALWVGRSSKSTTA